MAKANPLSQQQRRFVDEYLVDLNSAAAAIRAGYSKHTARQMGSRLLTKVNIAAEIAKRGQKAQARLEVTADEVRLFWAEIMRDATLDREVRLSASDKLAKALGVYTHRIQVTGSLTLVDLLLAADKQIVRLDEKPAHTH
jgi:phage terminase small subunit